MPILLLIVTAAIMVGLKLALSAVIASAGFAPMAVIEGAILVVMFVFSLRGDHISDSLWTVNENVEWLNECVTRLGHSLDSVRWDQNLTQLRLNLERLERIDFRMVQALCFVLFASLGLMWLLEPPRYLIWMWLIAFMAFYVRWTVIILRYEKALLEGRGWGGYRGSHSAHSTTAIMVRHERLGNVAENCVQRSRTKTTTGTFSIPVIALFCGGPVIVRLSPSSLK